jgi:hypothetical protein
MYNIQGFTLEGVYNYFEKKEQPLFENISLFQGGTVFNNEWEDGEVIPPINKDLVVDYIMENNNGLLCYRQNPDRFKHMVENFFESNYQAFKVIWLAINLSYNPIDNYDRKEYHLNEYNSSNTRTDTTRYKNTDDTNYLGVENESVTPSGTESVATSYNGNEITTNTLSADNNENWSNDTKSEVNRPTETSTTSFSSRTTDTEKSFTNRWDKGTFEHIYISGNDLTEHGGDDTLKVWSHGNIGVAKTSEIWTDEVKARLSFNFYEMVAKKFAQALLLEIY